jgi:hypothetical protein
VELRMDCLIVNLRKGEGGGSFDRGQKGVVD